MERVREIITAQVRSYAKRIGLTHQQARACVNAALNEWGQLSARRHQVESFDRDNAIMRATSHGRFLAGRFAEGNQHG